MNDMLGGDDVMPALGGAGSINPAAVDLVMTTITGSAGRFAQSLVDLPWKMFTDPTEIAHYDIPFARRVYTTPSKSVDTMRFYDNLQAIDIAKERVKQYEQAYGQAKGTARRDALMRLREIREEHEHELLLEEAAKGYRARVRELRQRYPMIDQLPQSRRNEERRKVTDEINRVMKNFNREFNRLKRAA